MSSWLQIGMRTHRPRGILPWALSWRLGTEKPGLALISFLFPTLTFLNTIPDHNPVTTTQKPPRTTQNHPKLTATMFNHIRQLRARFHEKIGRHEQYVPGVKGQGLYQRYQAHSSRRTVVLNKQTADMRAGTSTVPIGTQTIRNGSCTRP
jgi:hypothetical protein